MNDYKITIRFKTDRELTPEELDNLQGHLLIQIEEPMNQDNEDETYETSQSTYYIQKENN